MHLFMEILTKKQSRNGIGEFDMNKLLSRDEFRESVFARDRYKCIFCGKQAEETPEGKLDAHHIIERRLWSDGGYYERIKRMTESDILLLKLAAKAYGIDVYESLDGSVQMRPILVFSAGGGMGTMPYEVEWNPLRDDDQALRLSVKLKIALIHVPSNESIHDDFVNAMVFTNDDRLINSYEQYQSDPYAAARRAIVLVASELGKLID